MSVEPGWRKRSIQVFALFAISFSWCITIYFANSCHDQERWKIIVLTGSTGCFEFWLNRYQQLLAGLTALIAALVTVRYMRRQIAQAETHERIRRQGRLWATLSMLPFALSEIVAYARKCVELLEEQYSLVCDQQVGAVVCLVPIEFPALPKQAMDVIKECIEVASEKHGLLLADLAYVIQIQVARLDNDVGETAGYQEISLGDRIMEALEVYEIANSLYDFARHRGSERAVWLRHSAILYGLHEENYPKLFARIDSRKLIRDRLRASH